MMTDTLEFRAKWSGGVLRPLTNTLPGIEDGEIVIASVERLRSGQSHRHQFAAIKEAWLNLPEHMMDRAWAASAETMRKHALIATGYHGVYTLDCGTSAAAVRVKAPLISAEAGKHGYAVGRVSGPVLTIWTPESQSYRAMGRKRFQESKDAVLDWIAAQIATTPAALTRAARG